MTGKHTPGPWRYDRLKGVICPDGDKLLTTGVALAIGNHPDDATAQANARLIAAAPDMLPLVRLIAALPIADDGRDDVPVFGLDGVYITHGDVRAARAAIAKAEGAP